MDFSEKLIDLRRREGLSQEQLADSLGVTRQSVSKWESGSAMPELGKLITISDRFGVSIDYLVKDQIEAPQQTDHTSDTARLEQKLNDLAEDYHESFGPYYSYTSKVRLFGLPMVSIRFGRDRRPTRHTCAVGIIAIGNFSVGAISIGMISAGLLSFGLVVFGGVALGAVALGGITAGVSVIGASVHGIAAVNFLDYLK